MIFEVAYDASGVGIGGVFNQDDHMLLALVKNSMRLNNNILFKIKSFMQWCSLSLALLFVT